MLFEHPRLDRGMGEGSEKKNAFLGRCNNYTFYLYFMAYNYP